MSWTQITSREEFKEFYPYKSPPSKTEQPPPDRYPTSYPCFAKIEESIDVYHGCMHSMWVVLVYPPEGVCLKSFQLGLDMCPNND